MAEAIRGHDGGTVLARGLGTVAWTVELARSGHPTLLLGGSSENLHGRPVHSCYDPVREAERTARAMLAAPDAGLPPMPAAAARSPLLVGGGLGYLPRALRAQGAAPVVVLDPFPEITEALLRAIPRRSPLEESLELPDVHWVHTLPEAESLLAELLDRNLLPAVVAHPGYSELCRFELRWLARVLRRRLRRRGLDPSRTVVSSRGLGSLVRMAQLGSLAELDGLLRGRRVAVVSGGPSAAPFLPALRKRRGGVVMAAPQALPRLFESGVVPDVVVAPDPLASARLLAEVTTPPGVLLAEALVEPEVLGRWPERTFVFHIRSDQLPELAAEREARTVLDEPFATVSEAMVVLARELGARELALLGADFGGEQRHVYILRARGSDGSEILTNSHYLQGARYLDFLLPRLAAEGVHVLRAGQGLPIRGTHPLPDPPAGDLTAWLDASPPPRPAPVPRPDTGLGARLARYLEDVLRARAAVPAGEGPMPGVSGRPTGLGWEALEDLPPEEREVAAAAALAALRRSRSGAP